MSTPEQDKLNESSSSSHVSLFPLPPWQLINRVHTTTGELRPPSPPESTTYRMFGNLYNTDDAILRSLESQNVRRVYPQNSNRKRELRKLNFSILANYLDLLDVLTQDPDSVRRVEKLNHLAVLFINLHHLINEHRQHQARDLLREVLKHQVNVASETVAKAELYLAHSDDLLRSLQTDLANFNSPAIDEISLDPDLSSLLAGIANDLEQEGDVATSPTTTQVDHHQHRPDDDDLDTLLASLPQQMDVSQEEEEDLTRSLEQQHHHIDPRLWSFLTNQSPQVESSDAPASSAMPEEKESG